MNSKLFRLPFFVAIFIFMNSCTADDSATSQEASQNTPVVVNYDYSAVELETMTLINNYRVSKGLNALERINHISYKSEEHDEYMINNNVVNHNDFEARSTNIMNVLHAVKVGENIAYNYSSAKGVFDAWLNSPEHKKNIEGDYTHFGISVREDPISGKKYYTNIFAKI
jgi:uncharacterized protein YkwD